MFAATALFHDDNAVYKVHVSTALTMVVHDSLRSVDTVVVVVVDDDEHVSSGANESIAVRLYPCLSLFAPSVRKVLP